MRTGLIETQQHLDQLFMQGKVGFWISGPWLVDKIRKDNPSLAYGVALLPTFPGGRSISFGGGEYLAINNASEQKDRARKLVAFLTSPSQALEFGKALPGGMTPADLADASDPFLQGPTRKVFTEQMRSARMTPVHPRWLDMEEIIESEVSEAMLGNKEPQQALNDAQYRITQLLNNATPGDSEEVEGN